MKTMFSFQKKLSVVFLGIAGAFFIPTAAGLASPAIAAPSVAGLPDFTDLVEKTGAAVVNIRTTEKAKVSQGNTAGEDEEMQEFFRRFFGTPIPPRQQQPSPRGRKPGADADAEEVPRGVGSGFIISRRWLCDDQCACG
jgi:serine protease Do